MLSFDAPERLIISCYLKLLFGITKIRLFYEITIFFFKFSTTDDSPNLEETPYTQH